MGDGGGGKGTVDLKKTVRGCCAFSPHMFNPLPTSNFLPQGDVVDRCLGPIRQATPQHIFPDNLPVFVPSILNQFAYPLHHRVADLPPRGAHPLQNFERYPLGFLDLVSLRKRNGNDPPDLNRNQPGNEVEV